VLLTLVTHGVPSGIKGRKSADLSYAHVYVFYYLDVTTASWKYAGIGIDEGDFLFT
jgi:hypothetical protein